MRVCLANKALSIPDSTAKARFICYVRPPSAIRKTHLARSAATENPGPQEPNNSSSMAPKKAGLTFDLLDQLTFYGSYHNNKWNQLIHFFFVPSILWSLAVLLAAAGPLMQLPAGFLSSLPAWISSSVQLNAAFFAIAAYSLYYLRLEPVAGLSWTAFVGIPLCLSATAFQQQVVGAWRWALLVQVFSWYMQVHPGHALLEGRKPALLDSLSQALTLAPLFVWFELLFLLGYRPQLYQQLQQRVTANIAAFKAQQQQQQGKEA